MKCLLLIHLVAPEDFVDFEPIWFDSRNECTAAAHAFVERHPAFEYVARDGNAVTPPVVRSTVECLSARDYAERQGRR